jgi:hypothetical protein
MVKEISEHEVLLEARSKVVDARKEKAGITGPTSYKTSQEALQDMLTLQGIHMDGQKAQIEALIHNGAKAEQVATILCEVAAIRESVDGLVGDSLMRDEKTGVRKLDGIIEAGKV